MAKKKKPALTAPPPPQAAVPALPPPQSHTSLRPLVIDTSALPRLLLWALVLAFVVSVREVMVPLLFVGVLAFLGNPLVLRLERRGVSRTVGAGVVVVGVILALAALLALVVPSLVGDLVLLAQKLPAMLTEAGTQLEKRFGIALPTSLKDISSAASSELLDLVRPLATGGAMAKTVSTGVGLLRGAASALGTLLQAALVPVLGYFVLAELPQTLRLLRSFVPERAAPYVGYYLPRARDALSRLVRGQLIVAGIMALLFVVGLSIAGVPLALAVGILAGAAYLIPFASTLVCLVLAVALSLLELGASAGGPIVGALITCVVVQVMESYLLTPRIVGEQAGLSPLAALLAVLFGGASAGFLGVLFALPTACVLALILREEAARREAFAAGHKMESA